MQCPPSYNIWALQKVKVVDYVGEHFEWEASASSEDDDNEVLHSGSASESEGAV
jgi:hypothetical protein